MDVSPLQNQSNMHRPVSYSTQGPRCSGPTLPSCTYHSRLNSRSDSSPDVARLAWFRCHASLSTPIKRVSKGSQCRFAWQTVVEATPPVGFGVIVWPTSIIEKLVTHQALLHYMVLRCVLLRRFCTDQTQATIPSVSERQIVKLQTVIPDSRFSQHLGENPERGQTGRMAPPVPLLEPLGNDPIVVLCFR